MKILKRIVRSVAKPLARWASTPYDAVGTHRRVMGWQPDTAAINALLSAAGDELRNKSRDMDRKNAWARNAADSFTANAIGTGIVPQSLHPDASVREKIHSAWKRWTDEADANGLTDFYGLQTQACAESQIGGEVFARLRPRRASDGLTVPLQIQLLPAEFCPATKNEQHGTSLYVRSGIEFNSIGKRVAYHLYREHPQEKFLMFGGYETRRIDASEVIHLFKPRLAGQQRGEPWLAPVLALLYDLDKYDSAELIRKQIAAMMAFFIEDRDGGNPLFQTETEDDDGVPIAGIEPGSVITLPDGKTIKISEPTDVGGMYVQFMKAQLRKLAAGLGITYEQISGDLEGVNYSSIRAGLLEFRRRCEAFQHQVMVFQFCRPIWRAWMEQAALAGVIDYADYRANMALYLDVEWRPQAWPWVDPVKDIEAEILAVDNLLKSRTAVIKQTGYDREQVDLEIASDQDSEKRNGLERRATSRAAQAPEERPSRKGKEDAAA